QQSLGAIRCYVERFTEPGDLVLEPFGGGFTVAQAVRLLNRDDPGRNLRCIACDIKPGCVETGRRRLLETDPWLLIITSQHRQRPQPRGVVSVVIHRPFKNGPDTPVISIPPTTPRSISNHKRQATLTSTWVLALVRRVSPQKQPLLPSRSR